MPARSLAVLIMTAGFITTAASGAEARLLLFDESGAKVKIVLPVRAASAERDAARELARFLKKSSGFDFDIVAEGDAERGLFVGRTDLARRLGLPPAGTGDEGYAVCATAGGLVIVGGSGMATKFAVYDFLERYCGVRWFLPTELFEVVPKRRRLEIEPDDLKIIERPAFSPRAFSHIARFRSPCYDGENDPDLGCNRWGVRNRISADGRGQPRYFSHNLYRIIAAQRYSECHPEYFPLQRGKRFIPPDARHQNWQPCTTNREVRRIAVEAGRAFYAANPEHWQWFSLGINDGAGWCECERCRAFDVPGRTFRKRRLIASDRYFDFVSRVASALARDFPDRRVGAIAYASVEPVPQRTKRLPPNVNIVITQDTSQYHDEDYLKQDIEFIKAWKAVCNDQLYKYDYYGLTWLVPRYYPHIIAADTRRMRALGIHGYFCEEVPAWPTVGPMIYAAAHLLWNPDDDLDKRLDEFYRMCFGNAARQMKAYFERLEEIWMRPREGQWFEGLNNPRRQVVLYTEDDVKACRGLLAEAERQADDETVRKRVRFFRRGWELGENYIREGFLLKRIAETSGRERTRAGMDLLKQYARRAAFWREFKKEGRLLSASYTWFIEGLHREGTWNRTVLGEGATYGALPLAMTEPKEFGRFVQELKSAGADPDLLEGLRIVGLFAGEPHLPNLLANPKFEPGRGEHPEGVDWQSAGAPPGWSVWRLTRGEFAFKDGCAMIRGADDAVVLQQLRVKPGEHILASAKYRTTAADPATAFVFVRWKDKDAKWLFGRKIVDICARGHRSPGWSDLVCVGPVPEGAAFAVFMIGARDLKADEVVEFREPHLVKR